MELFLELLLTAVVALLVSFLVAKLVSLSTAGNSGGGQVDDRSSDQADDFEIGVDDDSVREIQSEGNLRAIVDENAERVDRYQVLDELQEHAKGEDLVLRTEEAAVLPENVIDKEKVVRGEEGQRESMEDISDERQELIVRTVEDASTCSVSPENVIAEEVMLRGQEEGRSSEDVKSGSVVSVEESNTVEESERKMELNTNEEGDNEEKEELSIEEEDDDWEGIEKSELEKAFAAASNLLDESGKGEEIDAEAKMELYGLCKIATEGSCREAQPMAVMVSARAKWSAWQKLGNMSQEEAMEQYLALVSKEIPGLIDTSHTLEKIQETETSLVSPPNSGPLEDPTILDTTGVASSKHG